MVAARFWRVLFLSALVAKALVEVYLRRRQMRSVRENEAEVPAAFKETVPLEAHRKAARYTLARLKDPAGAFHAVLLLLWTFGGGVDFLAGALERTGWGPIATGTALVCSALLLHRLLLLPFTVRRVFGVEARFGFNKMTPGLFVTDLVRSVVLALAIFGPLVAGFLWLERSGGPLWWIYAWIGWLVVSLFFSWLFPTVIAPLFNKFRRLEDPTLKERIERLLQRTGFRAEGVFVMDGSRRSTHSNAYFTGLGRGKRVVLFDTLKEMLSPGEVEAVLAHELGHYKKRHILKGWLLGAVVSLAGLAILQALLHAPWFFAGLSVAHRSPAMGVLLFSWVAPIFAYFVEPAANAWSRSHEFEADDFAAEYAEPRALAGALLKLFRENASTLTPDPLYVAFYASHPPASVRIPRLLARG